MWRQPEPGAPMNFLNVSRKLLKPFRRAPVLPADDGRQRHARPAVPANQAGTLRGESSADHLPGASTQRDNYFGNYGLKRGDQLFRVLLHPSRLRSMHGHFTQGTGLQHTTMIEHQRTTGMSALIETKIERIRRDGRQMRLF